MSKIKSMRIDGISYDIGTDYSNIDNTPTFKTINGEAITGTGNITIEGVEGGLTNKSVTTDAHINDLIDTKLGVIENGSY